MVRQSNKCPFAVSAAGQVYAVFGMGNPVLTLGTRGGTLLYARNFIVASFPTTCSNALANECPLAAVIAAAPSCQFPAAPAVIILPLACPGFSGGYMRISFVKKLQQLCTLAGEGIAIIECDNNHSGVFEYTNLSPITSNTSSRTVVPRYVSIPTALLEVSDGSSDTSSDKFEDQMSDYTAKEEQIIWCDFTRVRERNDDGLWLCGLVYLVVLLWLTMWYRLDQRLVEDLFNRRLRNPQSIK
ncbi:hypothetical protein T11_1354 [Trichinella zimbabwensis]|uniref:Uncharacterized protein n=1 Tax=Trichinella zimbabwensis TaxID=268475 RepID=A0A0V1GSL4_9BILA|nr:hypothetical protein T11_1354 [Trichinella zimbabwensis]